MRAQGHAARGGRPRGGRAARLGFSDGRNHLQTPRLRARRGGSDQFVHHGYADLYVGGRWVTATPAFTSAMCERFGVRPIEFDGAHDALRHPFSGDGAHHMEYGRDRGTHADLPFDDMLATLHAAHPAVLAGGVTPATSMSATSETDAFTAPA